MGKILPLVKEPRRKVTWDEGCQVLFNICSKVMCKIPL